MTRFASAALLALVLGCQPEGPRVTPTRPIDLPDAFDGAKAGDAREIAGTKLRWCPAGRFVMGSPPSEPLSSAKRAIRVCISVRATPRLGSISS